MLVALRIFTARSASVLPTTVSARCIFKLNLPKRPAGKSDAESKIDHGVNYLLMSIFRVSPEL